MTFLNWTMLLALAAVAVPIVIHLLNRRTAVVVEWGAMRFLMASMASRKRRVMLEEILLMVMRCLLVAVVALAMARPFLPSESSVPWAVVLPCVLGAAACVGVAAGGWTH
ncbi:MAG: BatA domain-containing protein, partial [Planctomycetota bacterium]|nr:BatA domain-containing protein [Planctomycetota bacterium]